MALIPLRTLLDHAAENDYGVAAFNVNNMAQAAAAAALDDRKFLQRSVDLVHRGLKDLYAALDQMGLPYFKTEANFFLIDVGQSADTVFENMLRLGGRVEMRTNWLVYAEEFAFSVNFVAGSDVSPSGIPESDPISPFERKYRASGHDLYSVVVPM